MSRETRNEKLLGVLTMSILGVGFLDLFLNVLPGVPFFLVWIIGFAVVLPIVAILLGDDEAEGGAFGSFERDMERFGEEMERVFGGGSRRPEPDDEDEPTERDTSDAIETLRRRYARGDLTDEQFETKLDRLLETDTPENAVEWRERERDPTRDRERDTAR
jgi:hypothetical protein